MKTQFISFLIIFLVQVVCPDRGCAAAHLAAAIVEGIHVIDKNSPEKDSVIDELLALQRSLLITPELGVIPDERGFILIRMSHDYVSGLLNEKNGKIIAEYREGGLAGYILLTDISEFTELYHDSRIGWFDCTSDITQLENNFYHGSCGYIEQIAVLHKFAKKGIGTRLVQASKKIAPDGLIADVFQKPLNNSASIAFFQKIGFEHIGTLYQEPRGTLFAHETFVLYWH